MNWEYYTDGDNIFTATHHDTPERFLVIKKSDHESIVSTLKAKLEKAEAALERIANFEIDYTGQLTTWEKRTQDSAREVLKEIRGRE